MGRNFDLFLVSSYCGFDRFLFRFRYSTVKATTRTNNLNTAADLRTRSATMSTASARDGGRRVAYVDRETNPSALCAAHTAC